MTCPTCQAEQARPVAYCPRCGAPLMAIWRTAEDADGLVIEGTVIARETIGGERPVNGACEADDPEESEWSAAPYDAARSSTSLVVARPAALPSLPARLWRQPAVRAVARASAGALALTLGMRLLRGALARPRVTGELASTVLPTIRHLFDRTPARRSPLGVPSDHDGEVVETFIYMRRVVRRR